MPKTSLVSVHSALTQIQARRVAKLGTDKMSVRLMTAAFVATIFGLLVESGSYILFIDDAPVYKVARLMPWGGLAAGLMFYACALACVPHFIALTFRPEHLGRKGPRKLMTISGCCGALLWFLLAMTASPLDYEYVTLVYVFRGCVDLSAAVLFAISLNAQRAAELWAHLLGLVHHVDVPMH